MKIVFSSKGILVSAQIDHFINWDKMKNNGLNNPVNRLT